MGIRFCCPNGHKLNVKTELAGKIGVCPKCGAKTTIPTKSVFTAEEFRRLREPGASNEIADSGSSSTSVPSLPNAVDAKREAEVRDNSSSASGSAFDELSDFPDADASDSEVQVDADFLAEVDAPNQPRADETPAVSPPSPARRRGDWLDDADDPLQDPNVVWCVQTPDNRSYGPAPSSTLKTWIQEKRISPEMFVWREGWERWEEAGAVFPEVRRIFALDPDDGGAEFDAFVDETTNRDGSGAAFASLAEAARSSAASRRSAVVEEAAARRRRDKARRTFGLIVALTGLVVALSCVLVYVLFFR